MLVDLSCVSRRYHTTLGSGCLGMDDPRYGVGVMRYVVGRWHSLRPRTKLIQPPVPYVWGQPGSGSLALARDLLEHVLCSASLSASLAQEFCQTVVQRLHRRRWHLSDTAVLRIVRRMLAESGYYLLFAPDGIGYLRSIRFSLVPDTTDVICTWPFSEGTRP